MKNSQTIDIRSDAFARRLANLLSDRREASGATIRELVRASNRSFNSKFLRAVEDGRAELDEESVCELAALYGAELAEILPTRMPLRIIDQTASCVGVITTSGITAEFDPNDGDSLLTSYLYLVRQLRDQEREPIIDLRREDVETIAAYLEQPAPSVLERLMTLMGATQLQRRAMVGMFIAGAIVIGLAGSGVAAFSVRDGGATTPETLVPVVSTSAPSSTGQVGDAIVVSGDTDADAPAAELRAGPEPLDGAPGVFAPAPTTTVPVQVIVVEVPVEVPAETVPVESVPAEAVPVAAAETIPSVGSTGTGAGSAVPSTAPGQVATGTPPVPQPDPVTDIADPPSASTPAETVPPLTIPDLPYDPPSTTQAPPTTEPPTTTPPTTEQVATGPPPVPSP